MRIYDTHYKDLAKKFGAIRFVFNSVKHNHCTVDSVLSNSKEKTRFMSAHDIVITTDLLEESRERVLRKKDKMTIPVYCTFNSKYVTIEGVDYLYADNEQPLSEGWYDLTRVQRGESAFYYLEAQPVEEPEYELPIFAYI